MYVGSCYDYGYNPPITKNSGTLATESKISIYVSAASNHQEKCNGPPGAWLQHWNFGKVSNNCKVPTIPIHKWSVNICTAHELRAWLLHYSPAVLHGILPSDYYQHHLLLVEAVFLLLQDEVEEKDVKQSLQLLKHYCFMFAPLYGTLCTLDLYYIYIHFAHIPSVI